MKHLFPSDSWVAAYRSALDTSEEYREAAATWTHGAIALAVLPGPEVPPGFCVWLDVALGRCDDARQVTLDEGASAPFCITASYERWRAVLGKRLDPIAGMITRRLLLRGNLVTMMRYVRSSRAMVHCATTIPSEFMSGVAAGGP